MISEAKLRANRENAKKAGRKKGVKTLEATKMREYIAKRVSEYAEPLVNMLLKKSLNEGNILAIRELFDRGFGRAPQSVDVTSKGESLAEKISFTNDQFNQLVKAAAARASGSPSGA